MLWSRKLAIFLLLFLISPSDVIADSREKAVRLTTFENFSRLEFQISQEFPTEWKSNPTGFSLTFSKATLFELGAPFGNEKKWLEELQATLSDSRLVALHLEENLQGIKVTGKWRFPTGENTLAFPKMDTFDYHKDYPPRYVLDFWAAPGPTVSEYRRQQQREKRRLALLRAEEHAKKRRARQIASVTQRIELTGKERFCRRPLSHETDIFLPFRSGREPIPFDQWFSMSLPDNQHPYLEPTSQSDAANHVRLALRLYREGKTALTIRTIEFFNQKFPGSPFKAEMAFLHANALLRLGHNKLAETKFRDISIQFKRSSVALYSLMYLSGKAIKSQDYLKALDNFMNLSKDFAEHRLSWVFHLGAAEALYGLRMINQATAEYEWVAEHTDDPKIRADVTFRVGDLHLERGENSDAVASYFKAFSKYPKEAEWFPEVYVNRAEALFWLGQYDQAEAEFKNFNARFASHPLGWRATYRLGEIFALKENDENRQKSREYFYETINRYPFSPGATLARIRLLPCDDHGGFDFAAAKKFFKKAQKFDGDEMVRMAQYHDFLSLSEVRTYVMMDQGDEAIEVMIQRFREPMGTKSSQILSDVFKIVFRNEIHHKLGNAEKFEAVSLFDRYSWALRKSGDPQVLDYLLELSQAASDLRMGVVASRIIEDYSKFKHSLGEDRKPAAEDFESQLLLANESFTKAKALWVSDGIKAKKEIDELLKHVFQESPFSFQAKLLQGVMALKTSNTAEAFQVLADAEMLVPKGCLPCQRRLTYWMATLHSQKGDFAASGSLYAKLRSSVQTGDASEQASHGELETYRLLEIPEVPDSLTLSFMGGEAFEKAGRWDLAIQTYSESMESVTSSDRLRFALARALRKTGSKNDHQRSLVVLKEITEKSQDPFWKKLAQEALEKENL